MIERSNTPIGKVIQDIIKGRNEIVKMIELDAYFTPNVVDDLILVPLSRLAKIDMEKQEKEKHV